MNRPGSGMARPGSNRAPGTRMGSSYGQVAGGGVALSQQVNVQVRPTMMREGMKGMSGTMGSDAGSDSAGGAAGGVPPQTAMGGQGRLVKTDRSYYISVLRPKVTDLTNEIDKLQQQEAQIMNSGDTIMQLQQKHKSIADETVKLKSQLADVNFAVEKSVSGDPDALLFEAQQLRQANVDRRKETDRLFIQVKEIESQQRTLNHQLEEELGRLDSQLAQQDPVAHAQYKSIRERAYRESDRVAAQQQELRAIIGKHDSMMASLKNDPNKKRAATLTLELLKLRQKREELNKATSISVEEERQLLMNESRNNAQEIEALQRRIIESKDAVSEVRTRLTSLEDDVSEYSSDNMKKYQELQEKDAEMQEYVDSYPPKEKEEEGQVRKVELSIKSILEMISSRQKLKENMPAQGAGSMAAQVDQMGSDLEVKQAQVAEAQATFQRLQVQVKEKREEAEMVKNLDKKISDELQQLQEKVELERSDIVRYGDLDRLRRDIEDRKQMMLNRQASLTKQRDSAKQQLHLLSKKLEIAKQQINENDINTSLATQEQRLRAVFQSFFSLDDSVRSREKEGSYTVDKIECLRLLDDCSNMLATQANQRRVEFGGIQTAAAATMNGPQGKNVFRL